MDTLLLEPIAQSFPAEINLEVKSVEAVIAKEKAKVTHLKEGVTGKQLVRLRIVANNASKEEVKSISWCIKQSLKHSQDYLNSFTHYNPADITPANLIPLLTEKQAASGKFSVWLVNGLIAKFYKG